MLKSPLTSVLNVFLSYLEDVFLCLVSLIFLVINLNSLLMIVKTTYSEVKLVKQNDNKNQEHTEHDSIENRSCSWFSEIQFETCFSYVNLIVSNLLTKYIILWNPKKLLQLPILCTFGFNNFAFINWSFILRRSQNWQNLCPYQKIWTFMN